MPIVRNRNPIEKAFNSWIGEYPESYHPSDMNRFYVFVKTVIRYSRSKNMRTYEWLKNKISSVEHRLTEEDVDNYCGKFVELQKFYKAKCIPIIEIRFHDI